MEPGPRAHPRAAGREPPVEDKVRGDRHLGKGPDMAHTLPLMADSQALRRFGKLYLAAFWFATASLYVSLIQAGYDPRLALTSAAASSIGCDLPRRAYGAEFHALTATPREDGLL